MAVKRLPAVLADGGEMTVVRRLVNFVWGSWQVTWPKDFEPPQLDEGRVLGYVGALAEPDPGLSARRFARADVEIVARDEHVTPVEPGASNVEEIFDETMRRASGEVFFEKDFPTKSLGRLVPFVDFQLGGRIPVRLWGRVLPGQLVTSIREVSTPEEPRGWLVHTGGQLLRDDVARLRQNREVERQIAQERRERERAVAGERSARQVAVAGEREAREAAFAQASQWLDRLSDRVVSLEAADGSTNSYGPEDPTRQGKKPAVGDTWFRSDSEGAISIWAWDGKQWVEAVPEVDFTEVDERLEAARRDVDAAAEAVRSAEKDIEVMRRELTKKVDASAYREAMAQHEAKQKALATSLSGLEEADLLVRQDVKSGALPAGDVKDEVVTAPKLAANAVVAGKIAANAVTAREIAAEAVTANHLSAGAVTADKVAADSITARHLQITPGNIFPDPHFYDPSWASGQGSTRWVYGHNCLCFMADGTQQGAYFQPDRNNWNSSITLEPGAAYRLSCKARFGTSTGITYVSVYAKYTTLQGDEGIYLCGRIPREPQVSFTPDGLGAVSTLLTAPTNMRDGTCTLGFYVEREHPHGEVFLSDVRLVRAADASLIVDGAVVADKLAANAVTTNALAAGAVTAAKIAAGTITAKEIKSGSLTSDDVVIKTAAIKNAMIEDGAITTAKIRDAAITSAKIGSLDAGKITSGTIDAARIGQVPCSGVAV